MEIKVFDIIGEYGITLDDGQKIYDLIYPELKQHQHVTVNFEKVEIFASPFLNAAVGQLLRDFSREELNEFLAFTNLQSAARPTLRQVIENAKEYYKDLQVQSAVSDALNTISQGE